MTCRKNKSSVEKGVSAVIGYDMPEYRTLLIQGRGG
jgi:hypothetical protein